MNQYYAKMLFSCNSFSSNLPSEIDSDRNTITWANVSVQKVNTHIEKSIAWISQVSFVLLL